MRWLSIVVLVLIAHISFLRGDFVWFDHNDIEQGRAVVPLDKLGGALLKPFGSTSFYRPAMVWVNSVDKAVYGKWVPGYRMTNLGLHLAVVAVVPAFAAVFWQMKRTERMLAAAVVGVHPAAILITGAITQRQEPLVVLFLMLTVIFHARGKELAGGLLFLSLLAKETALAVGPALILFWELLNREKRNWMVIGGEGAALVAYLVLRLKAVPEMWGVAWPELTWSENIGLRLALVAKWTTGLISPFKPGFSDAVRIVGVGDIQALAGAAVLLAGLVVLIKKGWRSEAGKVVMLTGIMLSPGLNFVPVPRIGSPHYLYLPAVVAAAALVMTLRKWKWLMAGWIGVAAVTTFISGMQFKNDETLFKPEVKKDSNFEEGYYYLGNYYLRSRNLAEARKYYELGLAEKKNYVYFSQRMNMLINLGGVKLEMGDAGGAYKIYDAIKNEVSEDMKPYVYFNLDLAARAMEVTPRPPYLSPAPQ